MSNLQQLLSEAVANYLQDLQHANHCSHTLRVYKTDLRAFEEFYKGSFKDITAEVLRDFFVQFINLRPATRARKQASVASFLNWAVRQDLIEASPLAKLTRVKGGQTKAA